MQSRQVAERERLKSVLQRTGVIRSGELASLGVSRTTLQRMVEDGELYRVSRGVYRLAEGPVSTHASLLEAHKRIPKGVICLLSALAFHEIGTQVPRAVWLAVDVKAWKPKVTGVPVRIVRFSGPALTEGIERPEVEGVPIPVYSPAKTVADCFKYRNKIGVDVAVEALRDGWQHKRFTMDELMRFATIDRVRTVITPYVQSLV